MGGRVTNLTQGKIIERLSPILKKRFRLSGGGRGDLECRSDSQNGIEHSARDSIFGDTGNDRGKCFIDAGKLCNTPGPKMGKVADARWKREVKVSTD